jgi:hypothetical protein
MPTFSRDTIRRFSTNISELKKLAARDFEDILQVGVPCCLLNKWLRQNPQCAIPAFEGLLPEPHNKSILRLLFICAHWHGLAKLRMHTDDTLKILDETTVQTSTAFQAFVAKTCPAFNTKELPREEDARKRRRQEKKTEGRPAKPTSAADGPKQKTFNLQIYKYHSLGDYSNTIRRLGTTDSYSTEPVSIGAHFKYLHFFYRHRQGELEHRTSKARYKRTNRKLFVKQLARIERREARLRRIRVRNQYTGEKVPKTPLGHHHVGVSQNHYEHIGTFLNRTSGDPATKVNATKSKR